MDTATLDPMELDRAGRRMGTCVLQCAPTQADVADDLDVHATSVHRLVTGETKYLAKTATFVRKVDNPWPVIAGLEVEAMMDRIGDGAGDLRPEIRRLSREETRAQGVLDVLQVGDDLDDVETVRRKRDAAIEHMGRLREYATLLTQHLRKIEADEKRAARGNGRRS